MTVRYDCVAMQSAKLVLTRSNDTSRKLWLWTAIEAGELENHAAALEAAMAEGDVPATSDPLTGDK